MGIVVDSRAALLAHAVFEKEVQWTEYDTRYSDDAEKVNLAPGLKEDRCENDGCNRTACAKRVIIVVVLVFGHARGIGDEDRTQVQNQVIERSQFAKNIAVVGFNHPSEEVKREEVEEQVHEIGVNEARSKQAPPLFAVMYLIGIQDPPRHQRIVVKSGQGGGYRKTYQNQGNVHADKDNKRF